MIITGTATDVRCDSTARHAFILNDRTLAISDVNAAVSENRPKKLRNFLCSLIPDVDSFLNILVWPLALNHAERNSVWRLAPETTTGFFAQQAGIAERAR